MLRETLIHVKVGCYSSYKLAGKNYNLLVLKHFSKFTGIYNTKSLLSYLQPRWFST